jgi:hypothetical protein
MATILHLLKWSLGLAEPETQTTQAERDCLARHAAGKMVLVELGVWHGVTTCRLCEVISPESVLYAVDPYDKGRLGFSAPALIAHREVSRVSGGRVTWIRKTSVEAASEFRARKSSDIEFLFVDAGHSYQDLQTDWQSWSPLIAPRGIVALHDSRSSRTRNLDGVGSAVFTKEVIHSDARFQCVDEVDSLTVMQRRPENQI